MEVGVTGGAGFIGTNLVRSLLTLGHNVTVIDDFSTGLPENTEGLGIRLITGSITDRSSVFDFGEDLDFIFHLGARGSVPRSLEDPQATFDVNVLGTQNLVELARIKNIPIVFSSSSSVYGDNATLPKNEDLNLKPITPYAASKAAGEHLVLSYLRSFDLEGQVFRFFNVYGPYQRPDHAYAAVIPKWIRLAELGEPIEVFGDGNQVRDFTYVEDVVRVLLGSMTNIQDQLLGPINLAFGNPFSLNELISQLRLNYANLEVRYLPARAGDVYLSANDPRLLKSCYPEVSATPLQEGLNLTIKWLQKSIRMNLNGTK